MIPVQEVVAKCVHRTLLSQGPPQHGDLAAMHCSPSIRKGEVKGSRGDEFAEAHLAGVWPLSSLSRLA